jgi:aminoglycoside phosphotransferase (APT) family kinase protein
LLRRPLQAVRIIGSSPSQPPAVAGSGAADDGSSGASGGAPDVSSDFRSEFAALLAFYAARIGAARRSLTGSVAAAIVQALMNEQAVALRALTDRWHAATEKQRTERPDRSTGIIQRKDEGPKPS